MVQDLYRAFTPAFMGFWCRDGQAFARYGSSVVTTLEVVDAARSQIDAWLRGESDRFDLEARLLGAPDAWEPKQDWTPFRRRLWDLSGFLCAQRDVDALA